MSAPQTVRPGDWYRLSDFSIPEFTPRTDGGKRPTHPWLVLPDVEQGAIGYRVSMLVVRSSTQKSRLAHPSHKGIHKCGIDLNGWVLENFRPMYNEYLTRAVDKPHEYWPIASFCCTEPLPSPGAPTLIEQVIAEWPWEWCWRHDNPTETIRSREELAPIVRRLRRDREREMARRRERSRVPSKKANDARKPPRSI